MVPLGRLTLTILIKMFKVTTREKIGLLTFDRHYSWSLANDIKPSINTDHVTALAASDEELSFVYKYFRGVPTVSQTETVVWRGAYAQFIFENL